MVEKSVEYAFVLRHVKEEALIAPFSGHKRAWGMQYFEPANCLFLLSSKEVVLRLTQRDPSLQSANTRKRMQQSKICVDLQ